MIFAPALTASSASAASLSSAAFSQWRGRGSFAATTIDSGFAGNSGMFRMRFNSSSVSTGRVIFTRRACSGVSERMFAWLPM